MYSNSLQMEKKSHISALVQMEKLCYISFLVMYPEMET